MQACNLGPFRRRLTLVETRRQADQNPRVVLADLVQGFVYLGILVGIYFLPTIIAAHRKVPSVWSIAVINGFLGWTLVGWVVALAMAVRTVPSTSPSTAASSSTEFATRVCPNCKGAMGRGETVCPHCGESSTPWVFHAGVWWSKGESDEWQWIDEKAKTWRWYKDGTPSDPVAADKTPNLMINPAVVSPPPVSKVAAIASAERQPESFAGELERLADLHARGALDDDQFEAAKARLLGS
jgi:hypothetical protein